jgi:hypothetical protein
MATLFPSKPIRTFVVQAADTQSDGIYKPSPKHFARITSFTPDIRINNTYVNSAFTSYSSSFFLTNPATNDAYGVMPLSLNKMVGISGSINGGGSLTTDALYHYPGNYVSTSGTDAFIQQGDLNTIVSGVSSASFNVGLFYTGGLMWRRQQSTSSDRTHTISIAFRCNTSEAPIAIGPTEEVRGYRFVVEEYLI